MIKNNHKCSNIMRGIRIRCINVKKKVVHELKYQKLRKVIIVFVKSFVFQHVGIPWLI